MRRPSFSLRTGSERAAFFAYSPFFEKPGKSA